MGTRSGTPRTWASCSCTATATSSPIGASSAAERNAAAFHAARAVIGLYGDQDVSWSILLDARLHGQVSTRDVAKRLDALAAENPHLGAGPQPLGVSRERWDDARTDLAARPYTPDEPLVRVVVGADEPRILIGAHHGAVDGIGLLALLGAALDEPIASSARGVTGRAVRTPFLTSAVQRLGEALFRPPSRAAADCDDGSGGILCASESPRRKLDTAGLIAAGAQAVREFNTARGARAGRLVAAVGAAKSGGADPRPEHDSTFLRLPIPPGASASQVRELLRALAPEPDFPSTSSTLASRGARLLAHRLGSTFLASNLGLVSADSVAAVRFHPAASGPNGLAFGLASTHETTSVTVHASGRSFSGSAADELLELLAAGLR